MVFGPTPPDIKGIQHFMKLAEDHDERNVVVAYYSRMAAIQLAMKIVPGSKPPEVSKYLGNILGWLEQSKKENHHVEGIGNETIAQALIEEYMLKLYEFAHGSDMNATFNKNMVKAYYTASLLCEVLTQFGELSEDLSLKCKTAKYRAAYIHNMLKSGQQPTPINVLVVSSEAEEEEHMLTKDVINERRRLRGEEPLSDEVPTPTAEDIEEQRKLIEEMRKRGNPEFQEELRRIKERIDSDDTYNNIQIDLLKPDIDPTPMIPDRIIDVGPAIYPEPRAPPRHPQPNPIPVEEPQSVDLSNSVATLDLIQSELVKKYCKFATSALDYNDIKTTIDNLEKALHLCRFGKEKE